MWPNAKLSSCLFYHSEVYYFPITACHRLFIPLTPQHFFKTDNFLFIKKWHAFIYLYKKHSKKKKKIASFNISLTNFSLYYGAQFGCKFKWNNNSSIPESHFSNPMTSQKKNIHLDHSIHSGHPLTSFYRLIL